MKAHGSFVPDYKLYVVDPFPKGAPLQRLVDSTGDPSVPTGRGIWVYYPEPSQRCCTSLTFGSFANGFAPDSMLVAVLICRFQAVDPMFLIIGLYGWIGNHIAPYPEAQVRFRKGLYRWQSRLFVAMTSEDTDVAMTWEDTAMCRVMMYEVANVRHSSMGLPTSSEGHDGTGVHQTRCFLHRR